MYKSLGAFLDLPMKQFFIITTCIFFFTYTKSYKDLLDKYYQDNKEKLQKRLVIDIKVFPKKKKKKRDNMVVNDIKNSLKMKKKAV